MKASAWVRAAIITSAITTATVACSNGGGGGGTPTGPTPAPNPAPQTNRAPTISGVTVTPTFGIEQLTSFSFSAAASDPDGDSLSYSWDIAGNDATGQSGTILFIESGVARFTVTVTDGRGGTATGSATATVGGLTGTWNGAGDGLGPFTMQLSQFGTVVRGSYSDSIGPGGVPDDAPGSISPTGAITIRMKQAPFRDWTFNGQMDATGRRVTGTMQGSGFGGEAFVMDKQ